MNQLSAENSKKLKKAFKENDHSQLLAIPKTDLHAHSYLSAHWSVYKKINPKIKKPPKHFGSLPYFLEWIVANLIRVESPEHYKVILSSVFKRLSDEGICYAELSFDPRDATFLKYSIKEWWKLIEEIHQPFKDKLKMTFELGLNRNKETSELITYLDESLNYGLVSAIDLYGDELSKPVDEYVELYKIAKKSNIKLKAHFGEVGPPSDIRESVEKLNLTAVQHGITAAKDKDVMRFLKERQTCINVCPSSNVSLGICKSIKTHPIKKLYDNGVKVTINSDDYYAFKAGVTDEIMDFYQEGVFSPDELLEIINNGLSESVTPTSK